MLDYLDIFLLWEGWIYLLILSVLEIVLGIDNILFISIVTDNLEPKAQKKARNIGLSIALILRLGLLSVVSFLMKLTDPIFTIFKTPFSAQSIILLFGGLFLIGAHFGNLRAGAGTCPVDDCPCCDDSEEVS